MEKNLHFAFLSATKKQFRNPEPNFYEKGSFSFLLKFLCNHKTYFWNCFLIGSDETTPNSFTKNFCLIWVILKIKLDGASAY